ncbi:MAG TPA: YkgJ family cysteine cluster protein [Fimbriimonadaceae bacterium]
MIQERRESLRNFLITATAATFHNPSADRFAKLAQKLALVTDKEMQTLRAEAAGQGLIPACKLTCDACCHRIATATLPEVLAAAEYVRANFSSEQLQSLRTRKEEADKDNAGFWNCRLTRPTAACPFLVDHACSIYSHRPLSCRALNSKDPALCRKVYFEGAAINLGVVPGQEGLQDIEGTLVAMMRHVGLASGFYDFCAAVLAVLDAPIVDLAAPNPRLERTKMVSEHLLPNPPGTQTTQTVLADSDKRAILELIGQGSVREALTKLDRFNGTPFERLLRLSLPRQYRSTEELEQTWGGFQQALTRLEEADLDSNETFDLVEDFDVYPFAYMGKDVKPSLTRLMNTLCKHAANAYPQLSDPLGKRKPGPLRLGFVSTKLANFNGSRWAFGWLKNMPDDFETYVFNLWHMEDQVSTVFRRKADHYYHLPLVVPEAAARIRDLDLDALIFTDVGMSGVSIQLACLRLARKQFAAWGHPVTTGSPQLDFFLASEMMEPPNGEDHYTEQLVRLPRSGVTYPRFNIPVSNKSARELGVPEGGYLIFAQNPLKLTPKYDAIFIEIAARSPKPLVVIGPARANNDLLQERLGRATDNIIRLPFQPPADYGRLLQLADVSLDSPGFNGGITTIDALTVGTPVLSLPGEFMRSRLCLAFLPLAGIPEMIAKSPESYVEMALIQELQQQARLTINSDPIYEDTRPSAALAEFIRTQSGN